MISYAILSCWLRISIFPGFCLGTVLKLVLKLSQLSSTPYCLLYTSTLLLCLSVCISLSLSLSVCLSICLSVSLFHSSLVDIDGLCIRAQALASDEWKEFGLSPWPFNLGRFEFRAKKSSINIDLCGFTGWRKNVGLSCVISNKLFCCTFE